MPKRKTRSTASKLKQGRGEGHWENYKPFLTVRDVSSHGVSHRFKGHKAKRVHHFLSTLELSYFFILEWSSLIVDIREQFPLPMEETLKIAERLGITHPVDPETKEHVVVTTDFLVDVLSEGETIRKARALKMSNDLGTRTIEKLEIERTYWTEQGVDWGLVTELDIPKAVTENVEWIHSALDTDGAPELSAQMIIQIEAALFDVITGNPEKSLAHSGLMVDSSLGLTAGTALWVVRRLIVTRQWRVKMSQPISTDKPLRITRTGVLPEASRA